MDELIQFKISFNLVVYTFNGFATVQLTRYQLLDK